MFELHENLSVSVEMLYDSPVYQIDNFYKYPDEIVSYIMSENPPLHRRAFIDNFQSYNGTLFEDRRHVINNDEVVHVYEFLSRICCQNYTETSVITNVTRFFKNPFNDFQENVWWPHNDSGYNGIVFLTKDDTSNGTNLYENEDPLKRPCPFPEHLYPWQSKKKYKIIKTIQPKYNRVVLFDGHQFLHGMNICDESFFYDRFRVNQVFFFDSQHISWPSWSK